MTLAYPYIRYSSVAQADGSSVERQRDLAAAVAQSHDLVLQPAIEDLGRSAATGANLDSGPLAEFFAKVHAGQIPKGSWLIVEDPDRISRGNPQTALNVLSRLVDAGLVIAYSKSGEVIQQGSSWINFLMTFINLGRANEENLRKQQLGRAGWKAAKTAAAAEGKALTRICPLWLRIDSDGRYQPIPERVALIHRMYDEAITLGLGSGKIARRLNTEGIPMWRSATMVTRKSRPTWDPTYIAKILSGRMVLGEYQPRNKNIDTGKQARVEGPPIPNFYPAVVDLITWQRAQASRTSRRGTGGVQREAVGNLLSGLVKCGMCGSSMTLRTGNNGRATGKYGSPRGSYLICTHRLRGVCENAIHYSYPPIEDRIIDMMRYRLLERRHYDDAQRKLELAIAQIVDRISTENQNASALIEPGQVLTGIRLRMLSEIEKRVAEAEGQKAELESKLAALVGTRDSEDIFAEVDAIVDQMSDGDLKIRGHARTIAQAAIRSLVDRVVCGDDGLVVVTVGGNTATFTLREVDRTRQIAYASVPEGHAEDAVDRRSFFASRKGPSQGRDKAFEIQVARWVMGIDGVLTEDELRKLAAGYVPADPRGPLAEQIAMRDWLLDLRKNPDRVRALIEQQSVEEKAEE